MEERHINYFSSGENFENVKALLQLLFLIEKKKNVLYQVEKQKMINIILI